MLRPGPPRSSRNSRIAAALRSCRPRPHGRLVAWRGCEGEPRLLTRAQRETRRVADLDGAEHAWWRDSSYDVVFALARPSRRPSCRRARSRPRPRPSRWPARPRPAYRPARPRPRPSRWPACARQSPSCLPVEPAAGRHHGASLSCRRRPAAWRARGSLHGWLRSRAQRLPWSVTVGLLALGASRGRRAKERGPCGLEGRQLLGGIGQTSVD